MNNKNRRSPFLATLLMMVGLAVPVSSSLAQDSVEDMLKELERLPPAQRAMVLEMLGQSATKAEDPISEPEQIRPRDSSALQPTVKNEEAEMNGEILLTPFGYELFAGEPSTFAPATDIPVPVDYIIGPGDTIDVQLFGSQSAQYRLVVSREGSLGFPEIGPINVAGLPFDEMRRLLRQRVAEQMIGVTASITMGPLRSIRIFVLGDVHRPGSYTVSSLSTMTNALLVSGGASPIGSLRKVQLKRSGHLVTTLDLYDLLLRGDTSGDRRLQPGDVIFIPPVGATVGVQGEVRRPAISELRYEKTIREVVELAGGMLPTAYPEASQVARIDENRERTIVDLDLSVDAGLASPVIADDLLTVFSVLDKNENIVVLQGHVYRPGPYQWSPGMRLTDIIPSLRDLRPNADLGYVMIRREDHEDGVVSVLSTGLRDALNKAGGDNDILLQPLDQITVFDLAQDRRKFVDPVLMDLSLQSSRQNPASEVRIAGRVRAPGRYPLEKDMRVIDLISAGGFLLESAYAQEAELARYELTDNENRQTRLITINLAAALGGNESANVILQSHDVLTIKEIPLWRQLEVVTIEGEVQFPGTYPVRRGEYLSSVLARAGGLTNLAFPEGAIFLREDLRKREQVQLDELATRIEREMQSTATDAEDVESRAELVEQIRDTEATGRLVIDLAALALASRDSDSDVVLRDGDRLLVPRESQTVTIVGEVQFPTSYVFEQGVSRNEYIQKSGGMTGQADRKRVYVVRADGSVVASNTSLFFRSRNMNSIRPGDTIIVPVKRDPVTALGLWTSVTTIIYNIGVAAAAVASFR